MLIELTLRELEQIRALFPKDAVHPATWALSKKLDSIVIAAKAKEGAEYIKQ